MAPNSWTSHPSIKALNNRPAKLKSLPFQVNRDYTSNKKSTLSTGNEKIVRPVIGIPTQWNWQRLAGRPNVGKNEVFVLICHFLTSVIKHIGLPIMASAWLTASWTIGKSFWYSNVHVFGNVHATVWLALQAEEVLTVSYQQLISRICHRCQNVHYLNISSTTRDEWH